MKFMRGNLTNSEAKRLLHLAHGAYGYKLNKRQLRALHRLTRGLSALKDPDINVMTMRAIALDHIDSWPLVRPGHASGVYPL